MLRATWILCLLIFAAFTLACGSGDNSKGTAALKRTEGPPDTPTDRVAEAVGEPVIIGGLKVEVAKWEIGEVQLLDVLDDEAQSREPHLIVNLQLISVDAGKKFLYRSWSKSRKVELKDDLGNSYQQSRWKGLDTRPVGQIEAERVYSDRVVKDVLVFERPVPAAKVLTLKLPHPDDDSRFFQFQLTRPN